MQGGAWPVGVKQPSPLRWLPGKHKELFCKHQHIHNTSHTYPVDVEVDSRTGYSTGEECWTPSQSVLGLILSIRSQTCGHP